MAKKCYYFPYPNTDDAIRCVNCGVELKKYWVNENGRPELVVRGDLNG